MDIATTHHPRGVTLTLTWRDWRYLWLRRRSKTIEGVDVQGNRELFAFPGWTPGYPERRK